MLYLLNRLFHNVHNSQFDQESYTIDNTTLVPCPVSVCIWCYHRCNRLLPCVLPNLMMISELTSHKVSSGLDPVNRQQKLIQATFLHDQMILQLLARSTKINPRPTYLVSNLNPIAKFKILKCVRFQMCKNLLNMNRNMNIIMQSSFP